MADISFLRSEDMEESVEPMDIPDLEEPTGDEAADGQGDEGGGELLSPIMKLQHEITAACDSSGNRQPVGRILVEIFRGAVESGTELNVDEVMQPVLMLVNDREDTVKQDLVEHLPQVAMICQEASDRLGDVLPRYIIQIIGTFLRTGNHQVRQSTHTALLALIDRGLLDKHSAEFVIAPTLLTMSLHIETPVILTLAIEGLSKVATILDEATAERLFLERFLVLCKHESFLARKICATRFGEFSAAVGKQAVYDKLLPMYVTLCKDQVWSVRKSCAEVMVSFACCVSLVHRRTTLSELLANFLMDDSKWVKVAAFQILGPFISTFAKQFIGFSYNQYGEFVMTDKYGAEFKYNIVSFASPPDPSSWKVVVTDGELHFLADDGSTPKSNQDSFMGIFDTDKENLPFNDRTKTQWSSTSALNEDNTENDATISHDYDQFNPFRYYYIPPDLPLDTELVRAATVGTNSTKWKNSNDEGENKFEPEESCNRPIEPDKRKPPNEPPVNDLSPLNDSSPLNDLSPLRDANKQNDDIVQSRRRRDNRDNCEKFICRRIGALPNINQCPAKESTSSVNCNVLCAKQEKSQQEDSKDKTLEGGSEGSAETENDTSVEGSRVASDSFNDTVDISNLFLDSSDAPTETSEADERTPTEATGQTIVPDVLVNSFVSMADSRAISIALEIPRYCAFSFPAVVATLGPENWPLLKKAYEELADAREYRVRRTMASSIHELAIILGKEIAGRDLLPIYDGFIKDLDEVRIGALKHLTTFLKFLEYDDRRQILPRLKAFLMMDNEKNWRFREEVASRLLEVTPLFSPRDVSDHIVPLSFLLLVDKVAAVRTTALALVTMIISYLSSDNRLVTKLIQDLKYLLVSDRKWTCRQAFALLCSSLLSNEAISTERFGRDLLPCLLNLSADVVPNVRLAVVTALARHVVNISDHLEVELREKVNQKLIQMRTDSDRDVRIVAGGTGGKYYPQGSNFEDRNWLNFPSNSRNAAFLRATDSQRGRRRGGRP